MSNPFNLLITSISKKVPLVKTVRQSIVNLNLNIRIFGGDSASQCVAAYFVDEFWKMPSLGSLSIEDLVSYCKKNGIKAIIPTRDGELAFFSKHEMHLEKEGIFCLISKPKAIEACMNKLLFYEYLSSFQLPVIQTALSPDSFSCSSYVVKECFGAGSCSIGLNLGLSEAKMWSRNLKNPIFQPFIQGEEYSIDLYMTRKNIFHGVIARVREFVSNGESQITRSIENKELESLCMEAARHLGIYGHAVFQALKDKKGKPHLIECNPRFGGASTLSIAMGLHSFEWFLSEILQIPLPPFVRSSVEMRQIRYPEDMVLSLEPV